jgi:hypothetical protein
MRTLAPVRSETVDWACLSSTEGSAGGDVWAVFAVGLAGLAGMGGAGGLAVANPALLELYRAWNLSPHAERWEDWFRWDNSISTDSAEGLWDDAMGDGLL